MILRRELPSDADAIRAVHAAAFARGSQIEAPLVDDLRNDGVIIPGLSVVALRDGEMVGHVVCSRADISGRLVPALGPLGVRPADQRSGVGSALMHAVLAAADALDAPCVVLLGDPGYYGRFGFEMAVPLGIHPPDDLWHKHFQLRRLTAWDAALRGPFRYAPAFDGL